MKAISIVIVNYKSYQDTIDYIRQLLAQQKVNLNVVVVDNDSPNESLDQLTSAFNDLENVHVLDSGKNEGYSYGNNIGIKFVEKNRLSEYVLISNNDIELEGDEFLYNFIKKYEQLPDDKAFASPVMYSNNGISRVAARRLPTLLSEVIKSSLTLDKLFGNKPDYFIEYGESRYMKVDCLPGSFFLGTTDIFKEINFFDENTFLYGEERILGYKINKKGYSNYLINDIKYYHAHSKTIDDSISRLDQLKLRNKNKIYYWEKYKESNAIKLAIIKTFLKISETETSIRDWMKVKTL